MGRKADLYTAVLDFITAVARHPVLVKLLVEERSDKKQSPGLQYIGDITQRPVFDFDSSAASMRASLVATGVDTLNHAQACTDLSGNKALAKDFKCDQSQESMAICKQLVKFYKVIEQTAPEASRRIIFANRDPWEAFTERNRVSFTDAVLSRYRYGSDLLSVRSSRPGRMAALSKEIATLTTSLPPGIFLKISESRPDAKKALITGVEGTPYEGGLFT